MKLKVATYNIWNQNYYWEERVKNIAKTIDKIDPNIIGFQEVIFEEGESQLDQINKLLKNKMRVVFFKAQRYDDKRYSGAGIMTNLHINSLGNTLLKFDHHDELDNFQRIVSYVNVSAQNKDLYFINSHFSLSTSAQIGNADELLDLCSKFKSDLPIIIALDLNNGPDSQCYNLINQKFEDSWKLINNDKEINTWPVSEEIVDDNWKLKNPHLPRPWQIKPQRMDFIFIEKNKPLFINKSYAFGDKIYDTNIYPSDHLGIVTEIEI